MCFSILPNISKTTCPFPSGILVITPKRYVKALHHPSILPQRTPSGRAVSSIPRCLLRLYCAYNDSDTVCIQQVVYIFKEQCNLTNLI